MKNFKLLSIALALIGVTGATVLVAWFGFDRVAHAILSVGWPGFAAVCTWQVVVMAIGGGGGGGVVPPERRRPLPVFVWGRMVRDSAAACLPFSPVGGFAIGARSVTLHGVSWPVSAISTVVDLTAEFAAEILFALGGLIVILGRTPDPAISRPAEIGIVIAVAATLGILKLQRGVASIFVKLGKR